MTRILVTNDDGVRSDGLKALAEALQPLGEVTIVAPTIEASAIGHALTLRRPLRLERVADRVFAVDGTPTDCVNIAVATVLKGLPSLIVSGINRGWNLGDDVTYSGTVSGAPKVRAMELIAELEPTRRGIYAGAVGYLDFAGNLDFCITIRTIVMADGKAWVQAGAGIVADSNPAAEFQETRDKAKALVRALELAQAGL